MLAALAAAAALALSGDTVSLRAVPAGDVRERTIVTLTADLGTPSRLLIKRRIWLEGRLAASQPWRRVGRCAAVPCSIEVLSRTPATVVYRATLRDGETRVLRASRLVTVTWRPV